MKESYAIETRHLTKRYGEQVAVNDVCLHVPKGHIYGLLGRNGAGKTSIMKLILQLMPATSGETLLFGEPVKRRERSVFQRIGAIIETPGFYPNLTGTENLEIFAKLRGTIRPDAVEHALQVVGLPYKDKKLFGEYSLGMKQRLGIALSLMHDPEFLILDEPINGLDPAGIVEMRKLMLRLNKENGLTIIISSHILSELANMATCYGFIDHGQILQEMSAEELEAKEKSYVKVRTSDGKKAAECLSKELQLDASYNADDDTIYIYFENNTVYPTEEISRFLFEKGYDLYSLEIVKTTLEDFFIELLGGTTIE